MFAVYDNPFQRLSVSSVTINTVLDDELRLFRVSGVQAYQGGKWVNLPRGKRIDAKAGSTLKLRFLLDGYAGPGRTVSYSLPIPSTKVGQVGTFAVHGGNDFFEESEPPASLSALLRSIRTQLRNDQLFLSFDPEDGGRSWRQSKPLIYDVVGGSHWIRVRVTR